MGMVEQREFDIGLRATASSRIVAALLDGAAAYVACRLAAALAGTVRLYVPRELTFAALAFAASVVGTAWSGATLGKGIVGLRVRRLDGCRIGWKRALLREGIGKSIGALAGAAGLLAIAGRERRGWHDRLAETEVVRFGNSLRRRSTIVVTLVLAMLGLTLWTVDRLSFLHEVTPMLHVEESAVPEPHRGVPIDVETLGAADEERLAVWIEEHGQDPQRFLVDQCARFPVVIFGERHWERASLSLLCDALPGLHRAGLRCIAMEWLLARDDDLVERLVNAPTYDRALALELARHHSWRSWGWTSYMDVLEAVWRCNVSLADGEPALRVCGLDVPIDLPSLALAGIGDQAIDAPWWERLRVVRVIGELPELALRDAYMASRVARALARGERTLVWVGASHSTVGCEGPGSAAPPGRMGFLLSRRHPGAVTQIYLHDAFGSGQPGHEAVSRISALVERLRMRRNDVPIAWAVTDSPWASLQDAQHWSFGGDPGRTFGDLARAYLYLGPRSKTERSAWTDGYVTDEMFFDALPYYRAVGRQVGVDVRDARSAELALRHQ